MARPPNRRPRREARFGAVDFFDDPQYDEPGSPSSTRREHSAFVGFAQLGLLLADGGRDARAPSETL